eukprot:maker-scaffold_34-snap-gene-0.2-mRNA-1 protein AED:0.33 eAED:0.33 QI:4/1/1/1/0/0/2/15/332
MNLKFKTLYYCFLSFKYMKESIEYLKGHIGPVYRGIYSREGEFVLTGGHDTTIRLWNVKKPTKQQIFKFSDIHNKEVLDIYLSKGNKTFVSCGGDMFVSVVDVETTKRIRKLHGHQLGINSVKLEQTTNLCFTSSSDGTALIYDLRARGMSSIISRNKKFSNSVTCVEFIQNSYKLIYTDLSGTLTTFDIRKTSKTMHKLDYGQSMLFWIRHYDELDKVLLSGTLAAIKEETHTKAFNLLVDIELGQINRTYVSKEKMDSSNFKRVIPGIKNTSFFRGIQTEIQEINLENTSVTRKCKLLFYPCSVETNLNNQSILVTGIGKESNCAVINNV